MQKKFSTKLKIFTDNLQFAPEYRGKGIATSLLDKLVEEARNRKGEKLWLGASKLGCPVYLKYGFKETLPPQRQVENCNSTLPMLRNRHRNYFYDLMFSHSLLMIP